VAPWLHGILGHRIDLNLARELANRGARVDFFSEWIDQPSVDPVKAALGRATLRLGRAVPSDRTSYAKFARVQYSRSLDRRVAERIAALHAETPYDVVYLIANESHWLPTYVRKRLSKPRPVVAVNVRNIVEDPFMLGYERPWKLLRTLLSPLYPLIHQVEVQRLRQFDTVFSNSDWTSILLDYFYGIRDSPVLSMVDGGFYETPLAVTGTESESYVAVPTAALDRSGERLVREISESVPNLRTFGKRSVAGVPHAGFLLDAELAPFLANATASLVIFDYETLGLLPLESLAAGTPVATLSKQGVRVALKGNPHVRFGESAQELVSAIRELSRLSKDRSWRGSCRESVRRFAPAPAVDQWLVDLRKRSPSGFLAGPPVGAPADATVPRR